MKLRNGFVSNSSSASFCIYKPLMTKEQIVEFKELIEAARCDDYETNIGEDGMYFIGTMSVNNDTIRVWLKNRFNRGDYADYC